MGRIRQALITLLLVSLPTLGWAQGFPDGRRVDFEGETYQAYTFDEYRQLLIFKQQYTLLNQLSGGSGDREQLLKEIIAEKDKLTNVLDKYRLRLLDHNEYLKQKLDETADLVSDDDGFWYTMGWTGTFTFSMTTLVLLLVLL